MRWLCAGSAAEALMLLRLAKPVSRGAADAVTLRELLTISCGHSKLGLESGDLVAAQF